MSNISKYIALVKHSPQQIDGWHQLAIQLKEANQLAAAEYAVMRALLISPHDVGVLNTYAAILIRNNQWHKAMEVSQHVLELSPHNLSALINIGAAHLIAGSAIEALKILQVANRKHPNNSVILTNMATAAVRSGRHEEARGYYEQAMQLSPQNPTIEFNYALDLLMLGEYERGFELMESRWESHSFKELGQSRPRTQIPRWHGEDITNKHILIASEQGLGDTIQFFPLIKSIQKNFKPKRITFLVQPALYELLKDSMRDVVVMRNNEVTKYDGIDCYTTLMSLPYLLKLRVDSLPIDKNYIVIPEEKIQYWKEKFFVYESLGAQKKIGLCWAGGKNFKETQRRNADKLLFRAMIDSLPNKLWFSLQKENDGLPKVDIFESQFVSLMGEVKTMQDTAAMIQQLDLVISVDTSVAHLAGAMGKPVWLLNRYGSEWRWMHNRTTTPWYPSMKIYNQDVNNDWSSVISKICQDLR